jgi:hypothetical protein
MNERIRRIFFPTDFFLRLFIGCKKKRLPVESRHVFVSGAVDSMRGGGVLFFF